MLLRITSIVVAMSIAVSIPASLRAADTNSNENRLREALRGALIQARTAENDRAASEAEKAEVKLKVEALGKQVEALTRQCKNDKESADKAIANLNARAGDQAAEIARLKEELAKATGELRASRADAAAKEAARARLAGEAILMKRVLADQKLKNAALFKLGSEILTRYEKFGLGEALGAKEPFTGLARVKLENYVQDFSDKLVDQRVAQ